MSKRDYTREEKEIMNKVKQSSSNCYYCGCKLNNNQKTIDHKLPMSRGWKTTEDNLVVSCIDCNQDKDSMTEDEFNHQLRGMENQMRYQGLTLEDYAKYVGKTVEEIKEDIDNKLAEMAKNVGKDLAEYKKQVNNDMVNHIANELLMKKLLNFLHENNEIK